MTVVYHRGLAHRSFRMHRVAQAAGALVAASAAQRGPLWWVAHHRVHHRHTDHAGDPHSPLVGGLLWSHLLWMFAPTNQRLDEAAVPDLARLLELRLLDRFHYAAPAGLALAILLVGSVLERIDPGAGVSGPPLLVWGFGVSTVALWHTTFAVNSLGHRFARRRFARRDASRNLWWLALLTMGEGWHNNHHRFPASARQGLNRFEPDPSWWLIRALSRVGLVTDLRLAPAWARPGGEGAPPASLIASGRHRAPR